MDRRQEYFSNARMAAEWGWGFLISDFPCGMLAQ
jgi:hypothetical protein